MDENSFEAQLSEQIVSTVLRHLAQPVDGATIDSISEQVYEMLISYRIGERMSEQYNVINEHKRRIKTRYKNQTDSIREIFPNGCYTMTDGGEYVGINVMLKKIVSEMLELQSYELTKEN